MNHNKKRRKLLKAGMLAIPAAVITPIVASGVANAKSIQSEGKVVDLSYPIFSDMPVFPGMPDVEMKKVHSIVKDTFASKTYLIGTHTGTHTDARNHFLKGEPGIEGNNLDAYLGEALVISMSKNAKDFIGIDDFLPYESKIVPGTRIILDTGWGDKYKDQLDDIGVDVEKINPFFVDGPRLSIEAAQWLTDKGIITIAMDMATPNPPDYIKVHEILLAKNIAIIEAVANLDKIRDKEKVFLSAIPLNVIGSDGFPVRAVALV